MDDVDDILANERAGEDDIPDEDEEADVDEEGEDEGEDEGDEEDMEDEEDEEGNDDDDDVLANKKDHTSQRGDNGDDDDDEDEDEDDDDDDDDEDDDDDNGDDDDEDENGRNENEESDEGSDNSDEGTDSKNEDQSFENGNSQAQDAVSNQALKMQANGSRNDGDHKSIGGSPNSQVPSFEPSFDHTGEGAEPPGGSKAGESVASKDNSRKDSDGDVEMADAPALDISANGKPAGASSAASKLDKLHNYYTQMLRSAKIADSYNVYPTAAIPIQTDVNALAMSKGLKYLFLGGSDGFIRKYDFLNTMDGKLALTILQKHSLAESIQNAGIMLSYWENEIPQKRSEIKFLKNNKEYEPKVSPVYALEVQSECLFLLSGLNNGGITLQGVRYMEGSIGHYFKGKQGHTNVVNLLKLNGQEDKFLSASWDKRLLEWDLQTGAIINEFKGGTSEYSSLEMRPLYSTVDINEVASKMKNSKSEGQDPDGDDDMGSLFGDDEEEESAIRNEPENAGKPAPSSYVEEISKTTLNVAYDESVFMTSGLNGSVSVWDRRTTDSPVLNLERGAKVPPWCQSACWSMDGDLIYVGRRNAVVEEFDLKMPSKPSNTLKLPGISGPVSCVKTMPNNKQVLCASRDNIRIYDTKADFSKGSTIPFLIVPGHHGGSISNLYIDPTCRFLISTSGNRGWQGNSTDTTFIYEIDLE